MEIGCVQIAVIITMHLDPIVTGWYLLICFAVSDSIRQIGWGYPDIIIAFKVLNLEDYD